MDYQDTQDTENVDRGKTLNWMACRDPSWKVLVLPSVLRETVLRGVGVGVLDDEEDEV